MASIIKTKDVVVESLVVLHRNLYFGPQLDSVSPIDHEPRKSTDRILAPKEAKAVKSG